MSLRIQNYMSRKVDFLLLSPTGTGPRVPKCRSNVRDAADPSRQRGSASWSADKRYRPAIKPRQGVYGVDTYMDRANVAGLLVFRETP